MSIDPNRAEGRSISFKPFSLYEKTEAFGREQKPSRSVSGIVCEALTEYLEKRGVTIVEQSDVAEFMAKIAAATRTDPSLRAEIEKLVRSTRRTRRIAA